MKLIFILAALSAFAQENDWLIVPGQRIGPITANTNRADLDRIFRKTNVRDQQVDLGEGDFEPSTAVLPDQPGASLVIVWGRQLRDGRFYQNRNRVQGVIVCQVEYQPPRRPCQWHTKRG